MRTETPINENSLKKKTPLKPLTVKGLRKQFFWGQFQIVIEKKQQSLFAAVFQGKKKTGNDRKKELEMSMRDIFKRSAEEKKITEKSV